MPNVFFEIVQNILTGLSVADKRQLIMACLLSDFSWWCWRSVSGSYNLSGYRDLIHETHNRKGQGTGMIA